MFNFKINDTEYKVWFRHQSQDAQALADPNVLWKGTTTCYMKNLSNEDTFSMRTYCSKGDNFSRYEGRVHGLHKLLRTLFPLKMDGCFDLANLASRRAIISSYETRSKLTKEDKEALLYDKDLK